jgi:hypothetical protein
MEPLAKRSAQELAVCPALPHAIWLLILARVPADWRLRCAEVCPEWRDGLLDAAFWLHLDLSPSSGVGVITNALLRALVRRSNGGLRTLSASGCDKVTPAALLAAAAANAGSLRELHADSLDLDAVQDLLRAAPGLDEFHTTLCLRGSQVHRAHERRVLLGEPPFGPLRVRRLLVCRTDRADPELPEPPLRPTC